MPRTSSKPKKKHKKQSKAKCLRCPKPRSVRGLCRACYMLLRNAVKRDETSFADAEAAGMCLKRGEWRKPSEAKAFAKRFAGLSKKPNAK